MPLRQRRHRFAVLQHALVLLSAELRGKLGVVGSLLQVLRDGLSEQDIRRDDDGVLRRLRLPRHRRKDRIAELQHALLCRALHVERRLHRLYDGNLLDGELSSLLPRREHF